MLYSLAIRPPVSLEYRESYGRYGEHCSTEHVFAGLSVANPDSSPCCTIPSKFSNLVLWQHAEIMWVLCGCTGMVDCVYCLHGHAPFRKGRTKIRGCP